MLPYHSPILFHASSFLYTLIPTFVPHGSDVKHFKCLSVIFFTSLPGHCTLVFCNQKLETSLKKLNKIRSINFKWQAVLHVILWHYCLLCVLLNHRFIMKFFKWNLTILYWEYDYYSGDFSHGALYHTDLRLKLWIYDEPQKYWIS